MSKCDMCIAFDKKKIKYKKIRSAFVSCGTKIKSNKDKMVIGVKISASNMPLIQGKLEIKERRKTNTIVDNEGDLVFEKYLTTK